MALSMLTACGGTTTTTNDITTDDLKSSNGVVAYIQANMDKDKVGSNQAAVTLSGNETSDKATAVKALKNADQLSDLLKTMTTIRTTESGESGVAIAEYGHYNADKTYTFVVAKDGYSDSDLGDAILGRMEDLKNANAGRYIYAKISVFDAEVTYNGTAYYTYTVDGTTIIDNTAEYWVVVVTTGSNPNTTAGQY